MPHSRQWQSNVCWCRPVTEIVGRNWPRQQKKVFFSSVRSDFFFTENKIGWLIFFSFSRSTLHCEVFIAVVLIVAELGDPWTFFLSNSTTKNLVPSSTQPLLCCSSAQRNKSPLKASKYEVLHWKTDDAWETFYITSLLSTFKLTLLFAEEAKKTPLTFKMEKV